MTVIIQTSIRRSVVFSCIAVLLACACPGFANDEISVREVRGPFYPLMKEHTWCQRTYGIANNTDSPKQIRISCQATGAGGRQLWYSRTITIPPRSQRLTDFAYRPETLTATTRKPRSDPYASVQSDMSRVLWNASTGEKLKTQTERILKLAQGVTPVVMIGETIENDDSSYLRRMPGDPLGPIQMLYSRVEKLPTRWYGYSIVRMVALGAVDLADMQLSQQEALEQWVRRGGVLILTGSERMPEMLRSRLGELAGVSAVGVHRVRNLMVSGPKVENKSVRLKWALPLAELLVESADIVYHANDVPLLTHRTIGAGHVFVLAAPLGALLPTEMHAVWGQIKHITRPVQPLDEDNFLAAARETLNQIAGRPAPKRSFPVAIIGIMIAFVLVGGVILRFWRRGELLWLVLIPVAILISFGLYGYGKTLSNPERLSHIGLVSDIGGGKARFQQVSAYYSGPTGQELTLSAGNNTGVITGIGGGAGAMESVQIETNVAIDFPDRNVKPNSTFAVYGDTVGSTVGIVSDLTFDENGLSGTIRNECPDDIEDAILYVNRRCYRIGNLPAGKDTRVTVTEGDLLGAHQFTAAAQPHVLRNELLAKLRNLPKQGKPVRSVPLIIGYTLWNPIDPTGGRELVHKGWSVIAWPAQFSAPAPGSKVTLPSGLLDLQVVNVKQMSWDRLKNEFRKDLIFNKAEVVILARPPKFMKSLTDASVELNIAIVANNYRLKVSGAKVTLDAEERNATVVSRTEIEKRDNPSGKVSVSIPQPDRFQDAQGRFVFSLQIEKILTGDVDPSTIAKWHFNDVNVVLKGTVR